jgi:ubiquinone/menaquinone biosynthesis C-methylase UbiE
MELMNISNQKTYETEDIIRSYFLKDELQKPEETILNILKDGLKNMRMLDIGVGGGRTTIHFAPLVRQYIGIDYSKNMIGACKKRFPEFAGKDYFKICDASNMAIFENNYFDFILFSFNGIDYISHEDRIKALKEIKRISKSNGYFCFSSHNLNTDIENNFNIKFTNNPVKLLYRIYYYLLFKFLTKNFKRLQKTSNYLIINDGARKFRLKTYYIKPVEQINQLAALGFKDIRVYSLSEGNEIKNKFSLNTLKDSWLYYLCRT